MAALPRRPSGFQPWLVTQAGCLDSHIWWILVAHLTEPVGPKKFRGMDADRDARAVETLFDLLDEFLSTCSTSSWSFAMGTTACTGYSPLMSSGVVFASRTGAELPTQPRARPSDGRGPPARQPVRCGGSVW